MAVKHITAWPFWFLLQLFFSFSFVFSSSSALLSVSQTVNAGFLFLFDLFSGFGKTSNSLKIPDDDEPVREDFECSQQILSMKG